MNNQWAASIGGPVKKDKLFFFFDTEGLRYILGTSNLAIIPTAAYGNAVTSNLAADSALGAGILYGTPVTGASVPFDQNLFSQYQNAPGLSRALPTDSSIDGTNNLGCGDLNVGGNFYPALAQFGGLPSTFNNAYGTNNGGGGTPCSQYFRSTVGQLSHEYILAGRVDYNMSNTDKLFFRARFDRGVQPTFTDIVNPSLWNATSVQPQDEGQVNWTHTFSPTVLNQFVGSVLYYSAFFSDPNQAAAQAAFGDGAGHGFALIDEDTSAFSILGGENYAFPQGRNVTQYQLIDDLSITRGPHALKMGFNFRRNDITDGIFGARAVTAEMISSSQTYLDGGYIIEGAQRFPSKLEQPMAIYSFGLYAQDEYRISSRLKLTLTLRADRNSNMSCPDGCFSNIAGGGVGGNREVSNRGAVHLDLRILDQRQTAGGLIDLEDRNVAAGGRRSAGAQRSQRGRAGVGVRRIGVVWRVVVQDHQIAARAIHDKPERVETLRKVGPLRRQNAVAAHHKLGDVGAIANGGRTRSVAVAVACGVGAAVQNINEPAAQRKHGTNRVGAARSQRQSVDRSQMAGIVVDLETGDDAVVPGRGGHGSRNIQEANRITFIARRYATDYAR